MESIKAHIDEVLTKLPASVNHKLDDVANATGQPKSIVAAGGAVRS